ncbi:MAG: hypothetical protein RIS35_1334 [Pseudomonadota bacterium]
MNEHRRGLLRAGGALAAGSWLGARAQDFPSRPITLVVPFSAGGSTDVSARRLGEEMSKILNTPVVIENKPGAGGFVATTHVTKAPKDGHTLLFGGAGITVINPHVFKALPYRVDELAPISTVSKQAFVLNGNVSTGVRNTADLIAYAKTRPDGLLIGTVGTGTTSHIIAEWIARTLGVKAVFVPYKGTANSTVDLIAGRIDVQIDGLTTAVAMHNAGKTRIVASMGSERAGLPQDVQTFIEAGHPALVAYAGGQLLAPAGTPDPVIRKLHRAVVAAMAVPSLAEKMIAAGEVPETSRSPEDFAAFLRSESERWGAIIRPMNLSL